MTYPDSERNTNYPAYQTVVVDGDRLDRLLSRAPELRRACDVTIGDLAKRLLDGTWIRQDTMAVAEYMASGLDLCIRPGSPDEAMTRGCMAILLVGLAWSLDAPLTADLAQLLDEFDGMGWVWLPWTGDEWKRPENGHTGPRTS
jgi:hypothetical protein